MTEVARRSAASISRSTSRARAHAAKAPPERVLTGVVERLNFAATGANGNGRKQPEQEWGRPLLERCKGGVHHELDRNCDVCCGLFGVDRMLNEIPRHGFFRWRSRRAD